MQAIACLPEERAAALSRVAEQERIEELRLRCGEAPSVRIGGAERPLSLAPVTADELRETVSRAARYSVHSYAESMRQGFLPLEGGHRLGLCGTAVAENGSVTGVRRISSLNLRVARQIDALDDILAPYIGEGAPFSLLVLAPPGCGKTTLVREWVRLVSDAGHTTAVADERGEIAGLAEGVPQFRIARAELGLPFVDLCAEKTQVFPSKGECRKMVQGGGVSLNKEKVADPARTVGEADLIAGKYLLVQRGKKNYYLVIAE